MAATLDGTNYYRPMHYLEVAIMLLQKLVNMVRFIMLSSSFSLKQTPMSSSTSLVDQLIASSSEIPVLVSVYSKITEFACHETAPSSDGCYG